MAGSAYYPFDIDLSTEGNDLILRHAPNIECKISDFEVFTNECEQKLEEGFATLHSQIATGKFIFNKLFPENHPLSNLFLKVLEENRRVRLRLHYASDADEQLLNSLLKIPWEYLYVGPEKLGQLSGFLCQLSSFSLVHCLHMTADDKSAFDDKESFPLKVSFLSALDSPEVGLSNIIRLIEDSSTVKENYSSILKISKHAENIQLSDYRSALKNDEIAQFLIHGGPDAIYFRGSDGELSGVEIFQMLNDIDEHSIRVVVLCACEGAQSEVGPSIQLHQRGIPVVIGFTKPFNTKKAIRFMEDFYSELKSTVGSVEEALAFARTGLIHKDDGFFTVIEEDTQLSLDWGIPRIFLAVASGELLSQELLYKRVYPLDDCFLDELNRRLNKATQQEDNSSLSDYPPEIDQWRKGPQRILYLYGSSGSGKSTQIGRFIKKNEKDKRIIYHFCSLHGNQTDEITANHPLVFVRDSLYPGLEALFGKEQYRAWVGHNYPYLINNSKDALQQLVIEPLRRARNSSKWQQPILIIDGLDRVEASEPGYTILDLLADFIQPLTEVMRLLITATSTPEHNNVHKRILGLLGEDKNLGEPVEMSTKVDWKQIQTDIKKRLPDELRPVFEKFLKKLEIKGQINYQFISFIKRILDKGTDQNLVEIITRGAQPEEDYLQIAYTATWNFIQERYKSDIDRLEKVLKALGAAYAPLPKSMLAELIAADPNQLSELLEKISYFIQEDAGEISCEHPSIKSYLESLDYRNKDNPHQLFLDMYLKITNQGSEWNNLDNVRNKRIISYAEQSFAEHAYRCYIDEREKDFEKGQDEYLKLMLSPGFRRFRKENMGEAVAIEDVRRCLRVYYIKTTIENMESEVKNLEIFLAKKIFGRRNIPIDKIWQTGNRLLAVPKIEKILGSPGDYPSPQLVALETELCNPKPGEDILKPLQRYWSLYYPTLFPRPT